MRPLAVIVAYARNFAIGYRGQLPWHVPEDLNRFKALTMGHAIIMGRATHESIGRPLPGRRNVVLTRTRSEMPGVETAASLDEALNLVRDDELPFIIGGAQVYAQALSLATQLFVTFVDRDVDADAFFPKLDLSQWNEVRVTPAETPGVKFIDYQRKDNT